MADWKIVELGVIDIPSVFEVHTESFFKNSPDFLTFQSFKTLAEAKESTLLGPISAESGESGLSGYILYSQISPEAELLSMATTPRLRNRGLGKNMLAAMMDRLKAAEVVEVFLEVNQQNSAAIGLYTSVGFRPYGERKGYYKALDGVSQDAVLMKNTPR